MAASAPAFAKYIQLDGVADIKTIYSRGCANIQDTANMAKQAGIDIVIFNDRARDSLQYGVFPLKRILKKTNEGRSILNTSPDVYLSNINDKNKQFRETLLIPGTDVSPFYYWTGSVFKKNLTAHNWDKRLSVIGLNQGEDFEQLPILDSNFSEKYTGKLLNSVFGFGFLLIVTVVMIFKDYYRQATVTLAILFTLLIFNNHPFRSSLFDQYHGDQGIKPYQEVIDFAVSKGAMVFWNDLEAANGKRDWGTIKLETQSHPEDLVLSRNYTGFQAVADEPVSVTEPGNIWDHVLVEYLRGGRNQPVWGYGGNGFQCAGEAGPIFGATRTVFLVREKTSTAVMDAMRKGRMYAVRQPGPQRLSLDEFTVKDVETGKKATLGEQLISTDYPEISFKIHSTDGKEKRARVFLIRNGKVIKRESVILPYELKWIDSQVDMSQFVYYRLNVIVSPVDHLVANPIFVKFGKTASVVTSVASVETQKPVIEEPEQPRSESPKPPEVAESQKTENPRVAKLDPPKSPEVAKIPAPAPALVPANVLPPGPPVAIETPSPPKVKNPEPANLKQYVRVLIDGVSLKRGPGAVFPEMEKVNKGDRLLLVRRTKIRFNGKVWLVVKSGDRLAYVWEGLVEIEKRK
ncbi:MAG: hypothetical protein IIB46_04725 [Nitrospinae bacterium]|nr:hypothetical protein [Nitrospinota bacterium]